VVIRVSDAAEQGLSDYLQLTDVDLRRTREPAEGLFIAEGEKVIRRALGAGYELRSLLLEEKWLPGLADVVEGTRAPVYLADRSVLDQVTGYAVHRGALASMARKPLPPVEEVTRGATRLLVLEDVNDHTNVGLIFRSAAALGADAVLLSPSCADPLYRRAVKTSMGAVLAVPWTRMDQWPSGLAGLAAAGMTLLALTPDEAAEDLRGVHMGPEDPVAVLVGSEGSGLRSHTLRQVTRHVRVPMSHGVDSLNVAAAAAIALYALGPGRSAQAPS
jgi:tRNA G18 (ribose-2'-O)-methylase SpoU